MKLISDVHLLLTLRIYCTATSKKFLVQRSSTVTSVSILIKNLTYRIRKHHSDAEFLYNVQEKKQQFGTQSINTPPNT
jgi:hypothetical protein